MMHDAVAILQTYLDDVTRAVLKRDWNGYRATVALPFHMITHAGTVALETEADLRDNYDGFMQTMQLQRVTDYIRLAQSASQLDKDLITGSYVTHLLSGGQRLLDPFTSQITLRRDGDTWRAVSVTNALSMSRWQVLLQSRPSLKKGSNQ
jgi:hypothetical protein